MAKIESNLLNMILVLTLITALVGAILGSVYKITEGPIAAAAAKAQEEAIREVAPAFDNNPIAESDTIETNAAPIIVYPARMQGKWVGAAVKATTPNGFNGNITVIVGFEADGTIRQYRVLSHSETPGLGAKMEEWFRGENDRQSIIGKHPDKIDFSVSKDGGDIDAITASTITSRAFLQVVEMAHSAYMQEPIDALSGSSQKTNHSDQTPQGEEVTQ